VQVRYDEGAAIRIDPEPCAAVRTDWPETGTLSQWLHSGLKQAGFEPVLVETRHVKAALSAMIVKMDRKDARGIAQLIRMSWFRPVHAKSPGSQEIRELLVARKQLLSKLIDIEISIRGILRGFGLKLGHVTVFEPLGIRRPADAGSNCECNARSARGAGAKVRRTAPRRCWALFAKMMSADG
jgi:transposase